MSNILKLHGIPTTIISDRDPIFTSSFWKELFQLQMTSIAISSTYHPQSDSQTEALNKCLETCAATWELNLNPELLSTFGKMVVQHQPPLCYWFYAI
jgi:hypothetical protein